MNKDIITQIITLAEEKYPERMAALLRQRQDISEFILGLEEDLLALGRILVKHALEELDALVREDAKRKLEWYIQDRNRIHTLVTIFGPVVYERTYYKNKENGEFRFLSDELVGIAPHDKTDLSLKTRCIEQATEQSYRKSGESVSPAVTLSGQSVMNAIRWLGPVPLYEAKEMEKREVSYLFVEADEDHVAMRDHRCGEPKLVYVHEGVRQVSKGRYELIHPVYFGGMFAKSDELWAHVENYIEAHYERRRIKRIYLSGDRAGWIRNGRTWIKDAVYVVDRYHLLKYIKQAGAHVEQGCRCLWDAFRRQDREYLEVVLETIKEHPASEGKEETLRNAFAYLRASFEDAKAHLDPAYGGCSAEGHISHIYSDRLSSRPYVWGHEGIDQMARLRVAQKNGFQVYEAALTEKRKRREDGVEIQRAASIAKKRLQATGVELRHNLTALNMGKKTYTYELLKGYRGA